MKKQRVFYHIGNLFIVISLFGFTLTFFPLISAYIFPPNAPANTIAAKKSSFSIAIPKIHAYADVLPNIDPWNEKIYQEALKKGVAHAKGTKLPGEPGTSFLFAHSSGTPWGLTRENTLFLRLGELTNGDTILVSYKSKLYNYTVFDKKEVWPNEVKYLKETKEDQLILQTCTPIGTALKRLLVFAKHTN
jgi:sortase A